MQTLQLDSLRSLSRIFSGSVLKDIIDKNSSDYFNYGIKKHLSEFTNKKNSEIINFLYSKLSNDYCNEYVFKNKILTHELLEKYKSTEKAVMLSEFQIGGSIADVVLLNGEIKIFEIKTDLDSFYKLNKQIEDYKKFADKVYIVVSIKNKDKIKEMYEKSGVGIIYLNNKGSLIEMKKASKNKIFDYEVIFKALRKNEYLNIIKQAKGEKTWKHILNMPNTLTFRESLKCARTIDILKFQKLALDEIKKRKDNQTITEKIYEIPSGLRYLCYNLCFSENDYSKLNNFLNSNFKDHVLSLS